MRHPFILFIAIGMCLPGFADPVSFGAMGDGPREGDDWPRLAQQVFEEGQDKDTSLLLHLGDITRGTDVLPEWYYAGVATVLKSCKNPVYIVPGDNEWNDLDTPADGWALWTQYFQKFETHWSGRAVQTQHQDEHPANLVFQEGHVLFIGLNLVGGAVHDRAEWKARHALCVQWVEKQLNSADDSVSAVVVFAQAALGPKHWDFSRTFFPLVEKFEKPVMFLHGDHHNFQWEPGFQVPNLLRVQVDQVTNAPPLKITVAESGDMPFSYDRRLLAVVPPTE